jgi:hypothetical protein
VILHGFRHFDRLVAGGAHRDESDTDPLLEARMRQLAETHLGEGIGRKRRNALLLDLGYDPSGPAGDVYRTAFKAAREAKRAAEREPPSEPQHPRGPGDE